MQRAAYWYTIAASTLALLEGVATLLFRIVPALDQRFPALLGSTQKIPTHSLLHVAIGVTGFMFLLRGGRRGSLLFATGLGSFYLALAFAGALGGYRLGIGLQPFDHTFHLIYGTLGLLAAGLTYSSSDGEGSNRPAEGTGSPISAALRGWLIVESFFFLGAIATITFSPDQTRTNWAWPIQPAVMAALFGGFYIAVGVLLIGVMFARRWEMVRFAILPTTLFTTLMLLATFMHWDRFSVGTAPFNVWFVSYLLPPPIFLAIYLWQQRGTRPFGSGQPLSPPLRRLLIAVGALLALVAALTFVSPAWLIRVFPWTLTPLTARALSGWLVAIGTLLLSMARENDTARVRLGAPMLVALLPAVLIQLGRFSNEVNWNSVTLWAGLLLLATVSVCGLALLRSNRAEALSAAGAPAR
ncbi:MAG TPA: hypothetical protein VER55_01455 [Ardenticatenaceae bacterium]|nr:hypothetical protein [Ardenticatenaceae bacterium]